MQKILNFDRPTKTPDARKLHRGNASSKEAAEQIEANGTLKEHCRAALAMVRLYPGKTGAELDALANANNRQISKRLSQLADCEPPFIRRCDDDQRRLCTVKKSNVKCVTWHPIERKPK